MSESPFRCGVVALLGQPNVGKSTLVNQLLNEKVSIATPKAQTTRNRVLGILQRPTGQVILADTPGYTDRKGPMFKRMRGAARDASNGADVVLLLLDASKGSTFCEADQTLLHLARQAGCPVVVGLNKVDAVRPKQKLLILMQAVAAAEGVTSVIPVSARTGDGAEALIAELESHLPEAEPRFDTELYTDASERFLCEELVREQLLRQLHQEIPHGTAVVVESFDDGRDEGPDGMCRIEGKIVVSQQSHKSIVLGRGGERIREVSTEARQQMESMLGCRVYLRMQVIVHHDWTRSDGALLEYGVGT